MAVSTILQSTLAAIGLIAAAQAGAETTIVTAARMLDVEKGAIVERPTIVVTDGRIAAIATRGDAPAAVPADAKKVDLGDVTLVPGLIDMHVHLTSLAEVGGYQTLKYTDSFWGAIGVANALKTLRAGFTSVRNVGAGDFQDIGLKEAIDGGWVPGPRITPAGYAIGATGGHCDNNALPPSYDKQEPSVVNSPEEARAKVRWLHKYGAEVIKICATGGVFSLGDSVGGQQLSYEEMKAIADEAHMLHMRVAAHAHGDEGIKAAILAGIDTIEHCSLASDEAIKLAIQHKTWFDMDIYNDDYILATGTKNGTEQESLDKERMIGLKQRQTFQRAVRAGVQMLFGTDAGVYPHGDNARQFAKMVEWGMTPIQAIRAATTSAAQALGRSEDVGSLAVGHYGDIVAVKGDPLADVRTLEHPVAVLKGGVPVAMN
ncbi:MULTISPECIES: amidohydrolase family protein [unclassified Sphingomonas]|uniref:Xaa-Pro dipeptidase n=1 Tax=unclassified Sphingomonas TaxID=196159 RepID=UPI00092608E4|nr:MULTISPECIES: amidohydrolase family protein [unclassified Sphingomonas]MBN8849531.1 amidohydrolase family protein [Sphingomonas sp.]OJV34616.1 MAG: Xaa-Pro dipeptidase [Sphingomonas sp. 67-36]